MATAKDKLAAARRSSKAKLEDVQAGSQVGILVASGGAAALRRYTDIPWVGDVGAQVGIGLALGIASLATRKGSLLRAALMSAGTTFLGAGVADFVDGEGGL
jgi:hypothetical protein